MLRDIISSNPKLIAPDTASFFKGFILAQDEVSGKLEYKVVEAESWKVGLPVGKLILQNRINDSNQYCTSIFAPHNLLSGQNSPVEKARSGQDWIFGVIVLCLILVAGLRLFFYRRFIQVLNAFVTPRALNMLVREGNVLKEQITPFLVFIQLISFSLFFFQGIKLISGDILPETGEYLSFLLIFGAVSAFFGFRLLLISFIGWIFETREQSHLYIVNSMIINEVWGIAMLPFFLIMFYAHQPEAKIVLIVVSFLFGLFVIFRLARNFMIGLTSVKFSWVYLFLYLCTVEILPLLILGKLASDRIFYQTI